MDSLSLVQVQPGAPVKPQPGAACNGCGVCCLAAPCPLGMLVSRKRTGACTALVWSDADQRYHCAMVKAPQQALPSMPLWLVPATRALARRWIASGSGCDCNLEVSAAPVDALPGPVADTQARAHDARVDPAC